MLDSRFEETLNYLLANNFTQANSAIILGTGLGGLVGEVDILQSISYQDIPHFPVSTVESHSGKLIQAKINNETVIILQGRFHYYEGYSMQEIIFPVRVLKLLGVQKLLISNACGSLNSTYRKGDLMLLDDHINLFSSNPLIGDHDPFWGPRFPDMSAPYDADMIHQAWKTAKHENIPIHKGVYVGVNGPSLETRAEYKFLRTAGADVVGMSTIPEVIAGVQMGMKIFAVAIVTDECDPDNLKPVSIQDIINTAKTAEPALIKILKSLLNNQ